ncbi:unnamed protein product [Orchesella dallaii]|uniref:Uncharacterized protein n=1 Tax=Orchesella dallaii TaxID=48710 RepID=A0ABP1QVC2_9HEXA
MAEMKIKFSDTISQYSNFSKRANVFGLLSLCLLKSNPNSLAAYIKNHQQCIFTESSFAVELKTLTYLAPSSTPQQPFHHLTKSEIRQLLILPLSLTKQEDYHP